ncbi:MAG: DEAD/DEAH box helicase, partial [Chloroflexi bacterium]|nr:DEAD/DEAH box helicase [Chloroflexota bacterium]
MSSPALASFHPAVAQWFDESFAGGPTRAQLLAWPLIASGEHTLLVAPTGSGKTLAAFLSLIDRLLVRHAEKPGVRVLYVSPLKALNHDVQRNLDVPLAGIAEVGARRGDDLVRIRTAVRTGDTLANERHRMTRTPPDILITTPESLYLILTSPRARAMLRTVEHVIVDEIHAVAGAKRGAHLALSLERLEHLTGRPFQRIGLSATQRPLEAIARFLGGPGREVRIADAGQTKAMDLRVESVVEDYAEIAPDDSIWSSIEPRVLELMRSNRTTLVFVNSRREAERLTRRLNELAADVPPDARLPVRRPETTRLGTLPEGPRVLPEVPEIARAHHGSMSREERLEVEAALKKGELRAVVATGSLELGIDIGSVDLVVQLASPGGVARGLQRVGRSGHLVGRTSVGRIIPKWRGDLVEAAAVAQGMRDGAVEVTRIPRNALDVLAQQLVAMAAVEEWKADDAFALVRRSHPYRELARAHFDGVLAMLAGKYPAEEFGELRPRIVWDRVNGTIRGRPGAGTLALVSGGTIPDRGLYPVLHAIRETKLGELDEEQVNELRPGDVMLLGARSWLISDITPNQVFVTESDRVPTVPFWNGDPIGRPYELGLRVGRLIDEAVARLDDDDAVARLQRDYLLDETSAIALHGFIADQKEAAALPGAKRVVIETYRDEVGDRRVTVLAPFGRQVLQPWAHALQEAVCRDGSCGDLVVTDDGIAIRFPEQDTRPPLDLVRRVTRTNVRELILANMSRSRLFMARFRENAQRSLLLPRRGPGRRTPLWLQRLRAADLLEVARKFDDFPIVHETVREILEDQFDLPHLDEVVGGIETGAIEVVVKETEGPSPFAAAHARQLVRALLEEGDRQQPEYREVMLSLDRALLRELLGTTSLRDLLVPEAIAEVESRLQRTDPDWLARDRDEVEDLLLRLGHLTEAELGARTRGGDARDFVRALEREGRARRLGDGKWAAVEETSSRDHLVRRWLRTHGPVTLGQIEAALGFEARDVLDHLEREGVVSTGAFTRGRDETEYVNTRVLGEIHRASIARLRREIEPKDPAAYARFLLRWHGIAQRDRDVADVLEQLQGVWLPVDVWERDVLPARVANYQTSRLDAACATGEFVWIARRGSDLARPRVAFFRRDDLARLDAPREAVEISPLAARVHEALQRRGAAFVRDLVAATDAPADEVTSALWELVWSGIVTNDAFEPLRVSPKTAELSAPAPLPARGSWRVTLNRSSRSAKAAAGRWSLVPSEGALPEPKRAEAWATALLERHGVVAYEHFANEETGLAWSAVADVLRRMELRGEVRRGHFVEGFSATQFAHKNAVLRLRDPGDEELVRLVAAMDPANPYGAALAFPLEGVARIPGAYLVLGGGLPALRVDAGGKRLAPVGTLEGGRLESAVGALAAILRAPAPYRSRRL